MGGDLLGAFVGAAPAAARERIEAEAAAIESTLEAQWEAARAAWPEIAVTAERFAGEVGRRLGADASSEALARTRATDIYLAIACADGDRAAIECLERDFLREVDRAAARLRATADQAAEVKAQLRCVLLVDEPGRPAAARGFSGRGDLRAYVRVMAIRDLIRAINKGRREVAAFDDEILDRIATDRDPEISVLRAQYREMVEHAIRAALVALDERSRALLRYQLLDGWSIDQIGRLYGVHRATAARWLSAARDSLGDRVRAELAARLQVDTVEVASIIRLVQSRLEVSFERLTGVAHADTVAGEPTP